MKTISFFILMLFSAYIVAQEEDSFFDDDTETETETESSYENNHDDPDDDIQTLFGDSKSIGGYIGLTTCYTEIDNSDAITIGGRLGGVFGHGIAFGVGGCGFFNEPKYNVHLEDDFNLAGGYGGFFIEPIIGPKWPVHISVPLLIGAGGVAYTKDFYEEDSWDDDKSPADYAVDSDAFFIFEPGVEIELNMIKYIRLCIGGYYRFTSDIRLHDDNSNRLANSNVLNGFSCGVTLKLGKF